VLQLGHVLFRRSFLRELPREHEFGFEYGPGRLNPTVERCSHPPECRVPYSPLDVYNDVIGIGLVPVTVQCLGGQAELDDEVSGKVLRIDLAALFTPEAMQGRLIIAHNDPSVRPADERTATRGGLIIHSMLPND
jgi:hypothetical protein